MANSVSKFDELFDSPHQRKFIRDLEQEENRYLPDEPALRKVALKIIRNGGKHLRANLLFTTAQLGKPNKKQLVMLGGAIELLHLASIVHDDIIDNAPTRRGQPSAHGSDGIPVALTLGDYLLGTAFNIGAKVGAVFAQDLAATFQTMCEGQSREISDRFNTSRGIDAYRTTVHQKTGALFATACRFGAQLAGLPSKEIDTLSGYGELFGVSFQIIDDLVDLLSTEKLANKPVGNDIAEGNFTLPVLLSLSGPNRETMKAFLKKPSDFPDIHRALLKDQSYQRSIEQIKRIQEKTVASLNGFTDSQSLSVLKALPAEYLTWAWKNQVQEKYQALT